jgi:ATP-dependent DNA ligase
LNLFSRNRIRLNGKYPEVVEAIHQQEITSFIADGEIVTFDGAITSFAKLQARMQVDGSGHAVAWLHRTTPRSISPRRVDDWTIRALCPCCTVPPSSQARS